MLENVKANPDTYHRGHITGDEDWYADGNDHIIVSNVIVDRNATLRIFAGVRVKFNDGTGLYVEGELAVAVNATPESGVLFTSNNSNPYKGIYYGIQFNSTSTTDSYIANSTIEYAQYAIRLDHASPWTIANNLLRDNEYGIYSNTSYIRSSDNDILNNTYSGIHTIWADVSTPQNYMRVLRGEISNNYRGIYIKTYATWLNLNDVLIRDVEVIENFYNVQLDKAHARLIGNNISSGNAVGISLGVSIALIDGNTIDSNAYYGIHLASGSDAEIYNNSISNGWNGISAHESHIEAVGNGILSNTGWGVLLELTDGNLTENNVSDNGNGIWAHEGGPAQQPPPVSIKNNTITYNGLGVAMRCTSMLLTNNTIEHNEYGVRVYTHSSFIRMDNNSISWNSNSGVYLTQSQTWVHATYNEIENNTIYGVYFQDGADGELCQNNIANNTKTQDSYGVYNADSSVEIDAEHNWWGDSRGPWHYPDNMNTSGDKVSDYVDWNPYETSPIIHAGPS